MAEGLTNRDIMRVVSAYIGVSAGYLGDFSYASLREFYPLHCDLDINPDSFPRNHADALHPFPGDRWPPRPSQDPGWCPVLLSRCPPGQMGRTEKMADEIRGMISRLRSRSGAAHTKVVTSITSATLDHCWRDLDALLSSTGATSAVDRIHTALHAYLHAACDEAAIVVSGDPTVQDLMKAIIKGHPRFKVDGPRPDDIEGVVRALSTMLHHLNPLRNLASLAHPNDALLPEAEAALIVGLVKVLIAYLDAKLRIPKTTTAPPPF